MSTVSTVVDCALQESLVDAVAIVDSALRLGKVTREELDQAAGARRGKPGATRLRQVLDLVGRVDFCWPQHRLVLECDGRRWHDPEDVRGKDRQRDNELECFRWRLLRITWGDVVQLVRDCLAAAA